MRSVPPTPPSVSSGVPTRLACWQSGMQNRARNRTSITTESWRQNRSVPVNTESRIQSRSWPWSRIYPSLTISVSLSVQLQVYAGHVPYWCRCRWWMSTGLCLCSRHMWSHSCLSNWTQWTTKVRHTNIWLDLTLDTKVTEFLWLCLGL